MPKVSVLVPIYKTNPDYLKEAIQSILDQTFTDFELLVLDDCPEDDREAIIKSFQDKRIKYLKNKKNLGITPSRNKLIDLAQGEYLAIMDHDDVALPERFEEEVKVLDTHPEIGVVGVEYERFPNYKHKKKPSNNVEIERYLMNGCAILHPSSMIRKSVLIDNNIHYEEEFSPSEDYALWCRLIGKTKFYNIPKVLFKYRHHNLNTSKTQADKMKKASQKIQDIVRSEHPDIYLDMCKNSLFKVQMKLFGVIPIGQFTQKGNSRKGILKYLPFITIKMRLEVK